MSDFYYEQLPIRGLPPRGSFTVPHDAIKVLGAGNMEGGYQVLLDTFKIHPMEAPLGTIPANVVRDIGNGNEAAGISVLRKFIATLRHRKMSP